MDIDLRAITTAADALPHLELLQGHAEKALKGLGAEDPPEGFMGSFLERAFGAPAGLLVVAESEAGTANLGLCLVGPHRDPLSGVDSPMVLVLAVDPGVRHRGLAGALVKECRRLLARRGFDRLAARCAHGDDALISMGERWGFVREWEFLVRD